MKKKQRTLKITFQLLQKSREKTTNDFNKSTLQLRNNKEHFFKLKKNHLFFYSTSSSNFASSFFFFQLQFYFLICTFKVKI